MDPFHVVRLAGDALDECRRRVQQFIHGRRGHKNDSLYKARRTLHTGVDLLPDSQAARLRALFDNDDHIAVELTWGIYQRMVAAYRNPDPAAGRDLMTPADRLGQHRSARRARGDHQARPNPDTTRGRRARLLRPATHQQRPDRGHQRPT